MSWRVRLKVAWINVARAGSQLVLFVVQRVLFRQGISAAKFRRILVYRIGNVGDILVTLPTLDRIRTRFPKAHIVLLTSPGRQGAPGAEQILPIGRWFDELLVYYTSDVSGWKGIFRLLRRLQARRADLFIQLPNQQSRLRDELRNMAVARLAGCRFAVGFEVSQQRHFLRAQALHVPQIRESVRIYRSVAAKLSLDAYRDTRLPVAASSRDEIAGSLRRLGIMETDRYVVMHVGAKRQTNQWPHERYAYVAHEMIRRWGVRIVLTGSKSELPLVERVTSLMQESPAVLCGQLDLPQMAALLERCSLYVGNDTGPMHLAAAVGTPTVSIFSARDFPERWYPAGAGHSVLRRDAPCSPCFKERCDRDLICLRAIQADEVLSAVERQFRFRDLPVFAHEERA
jgi:ADP-heptose:LPS heptosyltransferase